MRHLHPFRALTLLAMLAAATASFANVNTTPGSATASADTAANATSPSFTNLTNIVLTEGANTDFATPQSGVTLKLDAPAGWQFNAGVGSVTAQNGRDVTASGPNQPTINVTSSQITVTFTVSGSTKQDILTISGIQVQPTNGGTTTGGTILRNAASTSNIAGVTGATNFGTLTINVGAAKQLTMLTQPPVTTTAGIPFVANPQVQVRDQFGTLRSGDNTTVITAARGSNGTATLQGTLTATAAGGVATFTNLSYNKAETMNIAFSGVPTGVTSNDVIVTEGAASKLFFSGQPGNATAGSPFGTQPVVKTVDAFDNPSTIGLAGSVPVTVILSSGTGVFDGSSTTTLDIGTGGGNGTITYTDLRIDASGSKQLTAQAGGFTDGVSASFTVAADVATHFNVSAPGTAVAGNAFSFTVTALDQFENTATGYAGTVHYTTTDGNGTVPANNTLTAGVGTFSATLRTVGPATITATDFADNSITGTSATITVNPGPATHFNVSATASTTAGNAISVVVTALDAFNNTATGYVGTVHFTSTDGAAVLPSNYTFTGGDAGARTFSATLKTAGSRTITATDTVTASINGTSNTVTVNPDVATHYNVSAPASVTAGNSFSVTVTAQDQFNNTATGYLGTVHFTSNDGQAILPGDSLLTSGSGTFSATLKTSGPRTITATDTVTGSITGTSGTITVNPAAAASFAVSAPASATAGVAFSVTVTAKDAFNNTATGYAGTVHFTSSDAAAVLPSNSTLTSGSGTFSVTLKTVGSRTVTATDTVTASITGFATITVNPAAANHFSVSAPASSTAGNAFGATVTALDAFNNTATGYAGTVHITSSDGQAVLASDSTLTSGSGLFSVTLKTAGSRSVTATDTVTASITGGTNVTVNPAAASSFTVSAPASATAGAAFSATVTAKDPFNNTDTNYGGTVVFSSNDPQAVVPGNSTLTAGTGSFSFTLKTAGSKSVVATDSVTSSITGSTNVTVNATTATKLAFTTQPAGAVAGSTFTVVVKTQDAFGNNSTVGLNNNVTLNVTLTLGTGPLQGTVSGNIGNNGGAGTLTLSTLRIDNASNPKQLTAAASGFTSANSNPFTVNPGPTTNFVVSAPASTTAGNAFSVTVTAKDAFTNTTPAYAGTVHFTSSDVQADLPSNSTLTSGAGTFSVTLKTSGTRTVVATDTVSASITGSANVSVSPAAPANVTKTAGDNQTLASGQSTTATVHVVDTFNNVVPSTTVTFTITGGNGTVNSGATANVSTNGTGDASATWTFGGIAGPQSMTAVAGTGSATFTGTAICNYTTAQSGNWSSPSTWIGGCVPTAADAVTISSGHTITVDGDAFAASLTFVVATTDTAVNINPGITLSVGGAIVFNTPNGVKVDDSLNVGSGTLNAGSVSLSGAGAQQKSLLTVSTGTINISGSISFPGNPPTQLFNSTGAALINIGGNFNTGGSLNFDPSTTVTFNGAGAQTIGTYNPNNPFPIVNINKPTSVTMLGNLTVAGNLVIQSGSFVTSNNNLQLQGNLVNNATFTAATGTVTFIGTNAQTITGATPTETFNNLVMNNAAGLSLAKSISVNGALTFTLGNITTAANTLTLNSAGTTSRTSGHVIGHYAKVYAAAGSKTFETGTANGYSPVTFNATAGTFPATVTLTTTQGAHPNAITVDTLQRYWNVDPGSVTTADLALNYLAGDVVGIETAYSVGKYIGGAWSFPASSVDAINHVGTVNGVTSFGDFTLSERATTLVITSVNGGVNPIAGVPFNISVQAVNASGHATAVDLTTSLALSLTAGTSTLSGNLTGTILAGSSTGTITGVIYTKAETITVAVNSTGGMSLIQGTATFTVDPNVTTQLALSPSPATQTAGTAVSVTVTAKDAYGNTTPAYAGTIAFGSNDGQAVLPANYTFTGGDAGVHVFSVTLKTAGVKSVVATDTVTGSITGSTNVTINAAALDHFNVTAPPSAAPGNPFNYVVTASDLYGNTVTSFAGTVAFTSSDGAAILPANYTYTGGDAGTHTFSATLKTTGSQSITATSGPTTGSANVIVNPGAADHFVVTAPASSSAGGTFSVTVVAQDAFNNTATGYTGTAHFTSSDLNATLPANYTFTGADSGTHTFTSATTLRTAGVETVTATDTLNALTTGSANVTVNPGPLDHFLTEAASGGNIGPQIAGLAFNVKVTAQDVFNNTVPSFTTSVQLTSNAAMTGAPITTAAFNAGVLASQSVTINSAQASTTITATDTVSGKNGASNTFSVNASGAANFLIEAGTGGNITPQIAGVPFAVRVTVRDSFGNTVPSFAGVVNLTTNAGSISPVSITFTGSENGVITTNMTVTAANPAATITATSGANNGTSNPFSVAATGPANFLVEAGAGGNIATQTVGAPFSIRITARDTFGNPVTSFAGTVTLTTTAGTIAPPSVVFTPANNGIVTISVTVTQSGTGKSITATLGGTTGTSNTFTVNAATNLVCPSLVAPMQPLADTSAPTTGFLRWTGIDADSYSVYLSVAGNGCSTLVATTNEPLYFYQGLKPNTTYEWHIVANRAGCTGVATQCLRFHTPIDCQAAAQLTLASVVEVSSGATYHVGWTAVDATTYEIQESLDSDFTNPTTAQTHDTSVAFQHSATQATRYFYRARAIVNCPGTATLFSAPIRVVVHPSQASTDREFDIMTEHGSGGTFSQDVKIAGAPGATSHGASTFASGNFMVSSDMPWLKVSPSNGSIPPSGVTLTMTADTTNLPLGTSIAMVRVASTNGDTIDNFKVSVQSMKSTRAGGKSIPPKNSAIIPGVAHAPGVNSQWQSDVRIYNPSSVAATYDLLFTPSRSDGTISGASATVEVAAKSTMALDDVVRHVFGYGAFGGEAATGALEIRPQGDVAPIITSRTYNLAANGTYGQFVPAFAMPQFVAPGTTLSLQQVAQSSKYRTNFGLVDASGAGGTVQVRVMNDSGQELNRFDITLAPFEQAQFDSYLQQRGLSLTDGRIEVDVKSPAARIAAYASVIDNTSNDPLLVPAAAPSQISANRYAIPGVANYNTPSASWRSDVRVYNAGNASIAAALTFYPDNGSTPLTKNVTLAPGQTVAYDDVLPALFEVSNAGGALHVTTSTLTSLVVTARTYDAKTGATYGQFVPAVTPAEGTAIGGRPLEILHVEESPVYRANVGVFELSGKSAIVEFTATLPDGRTAARAIGVNPFQFLQIGSLLKTLGFDVATNARVTIRVIGGEGRVGGYASVVDNRTQDPTYVPAQ